jgi:predicted nuclease with RNAse H fold
MFFTDVVYVGVDPSAGDRPVQYSALDHQLKLIALDEVPFESLFAFIASLDQALIAVDAPQGPNKGFMERPSIRERYNLQPGGDTWQNWRVCEYELRSRNIRLYNTPRDPEEARGWVQRGFELCRRLKGMGFRSYVQGEEPHRRMFIEARSHAGYSVLLERRPFPKDTLEGRLQRQLVLFLEGLELDNPMHALEEITRHHLLTGHLPLERLQEPQSLDALMAAYTAYLVGKHPERISQVGEREEGLITLPTPELKDLYH